MLTLSLVVGLWLFASWGVADQLSRRSGPIRPEPPPTVAWGQVESLRLTSSDGEKLGAWFIPGRVDRPAVILFHGNGGSRADCLDQAEWIAAAGHPVFLLTLRAHGDSTGDRNDFGYSARHDVVAAVSWLEEHGLPQPVVWGRSLGSAAALFASSDLGNRVRGYVLECPYQDLRTAVRNRLRSRLPPPLSAIAYAGLYLMAPLAIGDVKRISPLAASDGVPKDVPVLVLAGGADERATTAEAEAIAARIGPNARVVVFPQAGHLMLHRTDPERYQELGRKFLAETMK